MLACFPTLRLPLFYSNEMNVTLLIYQHLTMSGADPDISEWMVLEKGQFQAFIGQFIFFSNKKGFLTASWIR